MNASERFFAKLRKLTVYLETESKDLLHASQNLKEDDGKQATCWSLLKDHYSNLLFMFKSDKFIGLNGILVAI